MKFNIEIEIPYIDDDYSLDEAFKRELKHQLSIEAAKVVAKQNIFELNKTEEVLELKKIYDEEIQNLKQGENKKREEALKVVSDLFDEIILGKAFVVNSWGKPQEETTVRGFIEREIDAKVGDIAKTLQKLVDGAVTAKMALSEHNIKSLVEVESKKVQNENAKKVAEFIVNGIK